ncbi:hypothetical protein [Phocaeicola sp.]|jgi:hypothetical protein|uniref:hypothetical protein n=1 Tax=Phocaeicola sp. TaxID=2773926 RepID=UPI003AB137E0
MKKILQNQLAANNVCHALYLLKISPYNVEINIGKVLTGKLSVKADKGLKAAKKQKRLHPNTIPTKRINI